MPAPRACASLRFMSSTDPKTRAFPTSGSRLVQAALAGLLSWSAQACSSSSSSPGTDQAPLEGHITSTSMVGVLNSADFQALCDARDGTVEVMAHCGGLATAAGFSYDLDTETLAEHTCKGANTCAGWNCITDS